MTVNVDLLQYRIMDVNSKLISLISVSCPSPRGVNCRRWLAAQAVWSERATSS